MRKMCGKSKANLYKFSFSAAAKKINGFPEHFIYPLSFAAALI